MNKTLFLMLLLAISLSCIKIHAIGKYQVIWVYSNNSDRTLEMEKMDSCLRKGGMISQRFQLDFSSLESTVEQQRDSLHLFLGRHVQAENVILFSVGECSYATMLEALDNDRVKMLITLSAVFLAGDDYVYNRLSLSENGKLQDSHDLWLEKTNRLRCIHEMILRVKDGKDTRKNKQGIVSQMAKTYLYSKLGRSIIRYDSEEILKSLHCPIFAIYSEKDVSWDFLSHQEFLQFQLNKTLVPYETFGPMQYDGELLRPKWLNILNERIMNFLKTINND